MRFHVPGLPHTVTNRDFIHCAFTQKVYKLCHMLTSLGHEVYHYGCEGSDPHCTEHIDVISNEFRLQYYPSDWHDKQWDYDIKDECHQLFYKNAIREISKRLGDQDFLLASWGWGHKVIADGLGSRVMTVESGIGYKDTFSRYRVFESYTWMSHVYGQGVPDEKYRKQPLENGAYFDAVIPNYFDPDDFDYTPNEKEDYFLYLGRIIKRKGIEIVLEAAKATGIHVKIAGQGTLNIPPSINGEEIEHIGFADVEKRRSLFSKAKGLLMPTLYMEPFGGVSIESLISGTPVICSDWGVFPETIIHGVVGYRCRTLDHFVWAIRNIDNLSPEVCREYALKNFSMERVSLMYQEYFDMLSTLWTKTGWYTINPDRTEMTWLDRYYPTEPCISTQNENVRPLPEPKTNIMVYPDEEESEYALDLNWYSKEKYPGISFILRAKNEEETVEMAIDSLKQLKFPFEVNVVLNQCTDKTEEIVKNRQKAMPINLFEYPFQLGKTGLENTCTPVTSVHSTIWMLNWILMKGKFRYTMRWDADFIMTAALADELSEMVKTNYADIANISAIFSDTGKANVEPYIWSNYLIPRYIRYSLWHLTRFAKKSKNTVKLKGKIIHDSPLSKKKDYWSTQPWWELEETAIGKKSRKRFEKLKKEIGVDDVSARASCRQSEELAKKVQQIVGIEKVEIPELKDYAHSVL